MKNLLYFMVVVVCAVYGMADNDSIELLSLTEAQKNNLYDFICKPQEDTNNTWDPTWQECLFDCHIFNLRKSADKYVAILQEEDNEIVQRIMGNKEKVSYDLRGAYTHFEHKKKKCLKGLKWTAGAHLPLICVDSLVGLCLSDDNEVTQGVSMGMLPPLATVHILFGLSNVYDIARYRQFKKINTALELFAQKHGIDLLCEEKKLDDVA